MRIALVTREFPPETAWGGIGTFYFHLARALSKQGHKVEVFAQGTGTENCVVPGDYLVHRIVAKKDVFGPTEAGDLGGNSDLGVFASSLAWEIYRVVSARHQESPFDLVEGHEHLGINAYLVLNQLSGCKMVTRYHTPYKSLTRRELVDWPPNPLIERLERMSIELADCRITSSAFIDRVIVEDFSVSKAEYLVPNFTEIGDIAPPAFADKEDLIIFVGRFVLEHKRPDMVASAFASLHARFPDWRLEFAGQDMFHETEGSVQSLCKGHLLETCESNYHFHGVLDRVELYKLYARAKLIVIPSKFESFGLIAVEAMKFGCVPVVSNRTALEDIVGDSDLTFTNNNSESLSSVLERLLSESDLLQKKYESCFRKAEQYSESRILSANIETYKKILTDPILRKIEPRLPLISIVTPSYNQGSFIGETIESVLNQKYPNFEHIVIDGGSSDDTVEVLRQYGHLKWLSESDNGQTHAINKGLMMASGDIVAYLNSDDVYREGAFYEVAKVFAENPGVQVVVGNCEYINERSESIGFLKAQYNGFEALLRYWGWDKWQCIPQQSVFIRKSFLAEIGLFDCRYHFVMDLEMWFRVALNGGFTVLDSTLSAFRLAEDTKTVANTHKMYFEEYQAFKRYRKHLRLSRRIKVALEAKRHLASKLLDMSEHLCLSTNRGKLPLELLSKACLAWPAICFRPRWVLSYLEAMVKGSDRLFEPIKRQHLRYLNYRFRRTQSRSTD